MPVLMVWSMFNQVMAKAAMAPFEAFFTMWLPKPQQKRNS